MPQKHPRARDRIQRSASLKLVQTKQVSVLEAAGLDDVAKSFCFFSFSLLRNLLRSAITTLPEHSTRQITEIVIFMC